MRSGGLRAKTSLNKTSQASLRKMMRITRGLRPPAGPPGPDFIQPKLRLVRSDVLALGVRIVHGSR